VAYANMPEDQAGIEELSKWCFKVVPVEDTRIKKWTFLFYLRVIVNIFERIPFSTIYHVTDTFEQKLVEEIQSELPDLIQCEWTNLAPFFSRFCNMPIIISSHNIESDIWKRFAKNSKNVLKKIIGSQQARRIEELEKYWYPKATSCIAVSNQDAEIIQSYGAKVEVIDNGVDINYYMKCHEDYDESSIAFTASFDTFSNQDGVHFFMREIYPLIKYKYPSVKLYLIGKNPPKNIVSYGKADSSVCVTGTVTDVRPFLQKVALCVVPLRIGGGSRLKILEAMAMKKAVVSTTIGAEGLNICDHGNIVIADEPIYFSDMVVELLSNHEKRKSLASSAFEFVRQNYNWPMLAEKQDYIWSEIHRSSAIL
jgi:glycosyltransferase involved in cell wall biosynthesis